MSPRLLAVLIIFPIWLTLVLIFRKHRQWLLYYLVAAFGLTIQLVFLVEYLGWDQILVNVASFHVSLISQYVFHLPVELLTVGRFQIIMPDGQSEILKLGIECSAVLESTIVLSLIIFYPLFNISQKILRVIFALVVTYVINIIRLMIIVLMAYKFGSDYIFIAHAGVARLFFFACELLLYWYLMTKPSVKSVGVSIKNNIPLEVASHVGNALQLRNAIMQIAVILIIVGLGFGSFKMNNDWQKTLGPVAKENRPIIYKDETSLEKPGVDSGQILGVEDKQPNLANEQILGDFVFESILSQEEKSYEYRVLEAGKFNIRLVQGSQPVQIEIYKNGQLENISNLEVPAEGLILDQNVFSQLISANPGDMLEIKFINTGTETASYVAEVISGEPNDGQVSSASTDAPITSAETNTPVPADSQKQITETPTTATSADTQKLATEAPAQISGKVLGASTEADQYSDLQKKNLKLQLENTFLMILSTILGAISLILVAIIVYLLKRKARRNMAEIISEESNEQ